MREASNRPESQQNKFRVIFKRSACLTVKKMHHEMENRFKTHLWQGLIFLCRKVGCTSCSKHKAFSLTLMNSHFFLRSFIKQLKIFFHPPVALFHCNCHCLKKNQKKYLPPSLNRLETSFTLPCGIELFPTATQKIHNHHNYWWHLINIQLPLYSSYSWTIHLFQPKTNALLIIFHLTEQPTCAHFPRGSVWHSARAEPGELSLEQPC